ncbi:MAG: xylulokinase [Chloroflexi bacterium]|nr:xylulokinase [Chloroflexota bacterium]
MRRVILDAYLGIDAGTTAVKVLVVDTRGQVIGEGDSPMPISVPQPGWSEQNPADWWIGVVAAVRQAINGTASVVNIRAIGLSGQMHSLVALDKRDDVIRPAILWNDTRTADQCREIERRLGKDGLRNLVGNPALEGFTAPKLLWLRDHEPENYNRIATVLLPKEYIRLKLTGVKAMDPSDAAGTLMFDIAKTRWSSEALAKMEIPEEWMPEIVRSHEVSGTLSIGAAHELGLPPGIPIAGGAADNAAAAIGSAVTIPGTAMVSIGTGGTVVAPIPNAAVDPGLRLHTFNHAEPDSWYLMGVVLAAGSALAWWRDQAGNGRSFDALITEAAETQPGADGLTFLPYLTGNRTPHADANARGAFIGLHAGHSRAHMTRAVVEGVTFSLYDSYKLILEQTQAPTELIGTSGGMRSAFWQQMVADVFGVPLTPVESSGSPYGAAILAACAFGQFNRPSETAAQWVKRTKTLEPNSTDTASYRDAHGRFGDLYQGLRDHFSL